MALRPVSLLTSNPSSARPPAAPDIGRASERMRSAVAELAEAEARIRGESAREAQLRASAERRAAHQAKENDRLQARITEDAKRAATLEASIERLHGEINAAVEPLALGRAAQERTAALEVQLQEAVAARATTDIQASADRAALEIGRAHV